MIQHKANLEKRDDADETPLVAAGALVATQNNKGRTALHFAAERPPELAPRVMSVHSQSRRT